MLCKLFGGVLHREKMFSDNLWWEVNAPRDQVDDSPQTIPALNMYSTQVSLIVLNVDEIYKNAKKRFTK